MIFKTTCILLFFVFTLKAQGQIFFGAASGINWNTNKIDIKELSYTVKCLETGYYFSIVMNHQFNNTFSLTLEPSIIQKNYSLLRTYIYTGINTKFSSSYLQLPIKASIRFGEKKVKTYLNVGGYSAYWLSMRVKGAIPDIYNVTNSINNGSITEEVRLAKYNEKYKFDSKKDRRFEFGLTSGIGILYSFFLKNYIFMEVNYFHSMSDQQRKNMIGKSKKINQTLVVGVGYMQNFSLSKKKESIN